MSKTNIENSFLMWVGSEHYPTFKDYADEAKELGVSKRLPGATMGKALQKPGTVVFVAHDDGEKSECPSCLKEIPCPECRVRKIAIRKLKAEIEDFKKQFSSEEALQKSGYAKRSLKIRQNKIDALRAEKKNCEICSGEGKAELGSGGYVELANGREWDYRTYNYWLHQPEKWDANSEEDGVTEKHICEDCGGLGTVPDGRIGGFFVPDGIEYILKGDETPIEMAKVESFDAVKMSVVKTEAKRKCGKRHAGGVYAVTSTDGKTNKLTKQLIKELVESGKIEADSIEVTGNFVIFSKPIDIAGVKRFRGIMHWTPEKKVADQAKMALESQEDDEDEE